MYLDKTIWELFFYIPFWHLALAHNIFIFTFIPRKWGPATTRVLLIPLFFLIIVLSTPRVLVSISLTDSIHISLVPRSASNRIDFKNIVVQ